MDHADRLVTADLVAALPKLRRYARVLVGGWEGADALVEETLAGAWRGKRAPPPGADILTWLFGLMHAAHRRDPQRWVAAPRRPPATHPDPGRSSGQDTESGGEGATADTCARLLRFPIEEREALLLVAVERLGYADIATVLDVPVATVMSRLARARELLGEMEARSSGRD